MCVPGEPLSMAHMQHVLVVAALANFQSIDSCVVWLVLYGCRTGGGVTTAGSMTDMMMRGGMPPASRGEQGKDSRLNLNKAGGVFEKAGLNSPPQPSAVRSTTGPFWARNMSRAGKPRKLAQTGSPAPSTSTKSPKLALGHGNDKTPGFDESLEAKPRADQPQSDSNDESDFLNPNLGGNAGYWALKDKADALVIKVLKQ